MAGHLVAVPGRHELGHGVAARGRVLAVGLELLLLPFLQVHLLPEIVIILLALLLPLVLLPLNISNEAERLPLRPELLVLPVGVDAGPLALYLILELFPVGLLDLLARVLPIQEHV